MCVRKRKGTEGVREISKVKTIARESVKNQKKSVSFVVAFFLREKLSLALRGFADPPTRRLLLHLIHVGQ